MILVLGGISSGKRTFARQLGYGDDDMSADMNDACSVLVDAHELARDEDCDVAQLAEAIAHAKDVVVFTEIGSGIVPLDAGERAWRERAGTLSRELADRADVVVRVVCGIGQVIWGTLDAEGEDRSDSDDLPAHSFFSNRACKYFPCHGDIPEKDFNCLFCYCPLYALGPDCGGNFTYTKSGKKNCKTCSLPHNRDAGVQLVSEHYKKLAALAARTD